MILRHNVVMKSFRCVKPHLAVIILSAFLISCTAVWLELDRLPPAWDDGWYLSSSLRLFDALVDHGVAGYGVAFLSVLGAKAPLIAAFPTPVYLLFGRHYRAAYAVNLIWVGVLFGSVNFLARRWASGRAALIVVCICGTMPLLAGLSRWYLVEFHMTALVALTMALLVSMRSSERRREPILLGVLFGLGFLLKITFPLYVAPSFVYLLKGTPQRTKKLVLAGASALVIALPWYMENWHAAVVLAISSGYREAAAPYGTGRVFSQTALTTYLANVAGGISPYYVALAILSCILLTFMRKRFDQQGLIVLALWSLPFLVFAFGVNKDIRFIAPILPAVALTIAMGMDAAVISRKFLGALTVALILLFPVASMLEMSFAPRFLAPFGAALSSNTPYSRTYDNRPWPNQRLIEAVMADGRGNRVLVGTDTASFNANNLELIVVAQRLPLLISTSAYEPDAESALTALGASDYFVYKDGGEPEAAFFNRFKRTLSSHLSAVPGVMAIPFSQTSPDGGSVRLFRLKSPDKNRY